MMRFPSPLCAVVVVSLVLGCDTSEPPFATVSPNVLKEGASWTYNLRFLQSPLDSSADDDARYGPPNASHENGR